MIIDATAMVKEKISQQHQPFLRPVFLFFLLPLAILLLLTLTGILFLVRFESEYRDRVYPGIKVDGISVEGKTIEDIEKHYSEKSRPLSFVHITLTYEDKIASVSGEDLGLAFDGTLAGEQAFHIGRSGNIISDTYQKWKALSEGINLTSIIMIKTDIIDEMLTNLALAIHIESEDALFQFQNGKVISFRLSKNGKRLDIEEAKKNIREEIIAFSRQENLRVPEITIQLPVRMEEPKITTENSNNLGIKDLIGVGTSLFRGSIPGRKHNIDLASKKISGHLIAPGDEFSFNDTLGDVSASTGFQPAYIIKEGRTVLGDGGGVCQVSTTLFRAILNAGFPVTERHAHAYRVGYYEQDSPPGLDATVFAPSYDLKFKNDTAHYVLIQSQIDLKGESLEFSLFGTKDDRNIELTKPVILSQTPAPPDLYQDDPTLPKGVVKQVDWKAPGAKVNMNYKVTKRNTVVIQTSFYSNYQPWQSVFLRGTKE